MATYRYFGPDDFSSSRAVKIDDDMCLWLARMAVGEGGKNCSTVKLRAMVWAMLNRYFLHKQRRKWRSFRYLVRRFSQPINPRWSRGGDLAIKYAGTKYTTEQKLDRRERISNLQWGEIPWRIEDKLILIQDGMSPPPLSVTRLNSPRISNWASHTNLKAKFPWGIEFSKGKDRFDWMFEDRNLIDGKVIVDYWG